MSQLIEVAEKLLRDGQYREAYKVVSTAESSDKKEQCQLALVKAEASLYLGRAESAGLLEALDILRPSQENGLYARAKFLHGWLLVRQGSLDRAAAVLTESSVYFRRYNRVRDLRRVLALLAQIAFQRMDISKVNEYTKELTELSLGQPMTAALYRANLSRAYIRAGHLKAALGIFEQEADHLCNYSSVSRINFHLSMGLLTTLRAEFTIARDYFKRVEESELEEGSREQVLYYEYLGQLELAADRHPQAEQLLKKALAHIGDRANDETSQVNRLIADLYVAMKRPDPAEKHARISLAVAEKINERIEIAACYRVFAQIEQHRGHVDEARKQYKAAIDLFNLIGARYELAVTRYLAGISGLYGDGERTALLYLAREYFEAEEVRPYVEKVDAALHSEPLPARGNRAAGTPVIVCRSGAMKRIVKLAEHVAQSDMAILLTGDTGTGKDLLARYIHEVSGRKGKFVTVNMAAIPTEMCEAELFGHSRGAFTGAQKERAGLIEQAHEGTLYLNEIGDAGPEVQKKLLEVLETRRVRRLGENESRAVSFRVIAATNRDVQADIRNNRFRLDLYHRLHEIPIHLPPLRERGEDIAALTEYFVSEETGTGATNGGAAALERLAVALGRRRWSGNVRQLRAEIRRLVLTCGRDIEAMADLASREEPEQERDELLATLEACDWNRREAARLIGVSEATVRRRIARYELEERVPE